jgi:hypothetical protein
MSLESTSARAFSNTLDYPMEFAIQASGIELKFYLRSPSTSGSVNAKHFYFLGNEIITQAYTLL